MRALKSILAFLGIGFTAVILFSLGWFALNLFFLDDNFRAEQDYFGDLKGIEYEFRTYYHGKTNYPAYTYKDLQQMGVIDKSRDEDFRCYNGHFTPFSSSTPDDTVVLRFNYNLFEPDVFTKRDLTAAQSAPDHYQP